MQTLCPSLPIFIVHVYIIIVYTYILGPYGLQLKVHNNKQALHLIQEHIYIMQFGDFSRIATCRKYIYISAKESNCEDGKRLPSFVNVTAETGCTCQRSCTAVGVFPSRKSDLKKYKRCLKSTFELLIPKCLAKFSQQVSRGLQ